MTTADLTVFDHLLVLLLSVALPVGGWVSMRRVQRRIASGIPHTTRVADYRNNMVVMAITTLLALTLWVLNGRPWNAIGVAAINTEGPRLGFAVLLAVGMVTFNLVYYFRVQHSDQAARDLLRRTTAFDMVLPHTRRELHWFYGLSFTAGLTEEILYRGFLIAYLSVFLTTPASVLVSSLVFACAHLYQGIAGATITFVIGVILAVTYVLTGSILLAVVAHILVDLISGRMIFSAFNRMPSAATARETC